jgi:hypothetical protein
MGVWGAASLPQNITGSRQKFVFSLDQPLSRLWLPFPALRAELGTLLVRGYEFQEDKPQIELGPGCRRVVTTGNFVKGKLRVANHSEGNV